MGAARQLGTAGVPPRTPVRSAARVAAFVTLSTILPASAAPAVGGGIPHVLRGPATVHLLPQPGPLVIRLSKHDLNLYDGEDTIQAALYDPFRRPLATAFLPDDGQAGKGRGGSGSQTGELRATVTAPGVHTLVIGGACHEVVYSIATNCGPCVVQENMLLNNSSVAGEVWFEPPEGDFTIRIQAKHAPGVQEVPLLDGAGDTVNVFDLVASAKDVILEVAAGQGARTGPWHFVIGRMDVQIHMDGVQYWAATRAAYFNPDSSGPMLIPRSVTRLVPPGGSVEVSYRLRNRLDEAIRVRVEAESAGPLRCRPLAPSGPATVEPKGSLDVLVAVSVAPDAKEGDEAETSVGVTTEGRPDLVSGSALRVRVGRPLGAEALALPIVLKTFEHEAAQFGYQPDYVCNEVHFDPRNRAFIRQRGLRVAETTGITLLDGGRWLERSFMSALTAAHPAFTGACDGGGGFAGAKIAFDGQGGAYTLLRLLRKEAHKQCVLVFTPDDGRTFQVVDLPGHAFDIEQFAGHNAQSRPPPILVYRRTAAHARAKWGSVHDLLLFLPRRVENRVELGDPVLVSNRCIGSCQHSGGPPSTATRDGRTHIVWGEVTDEDLPGMPSYAATYDHRAGTLGAKVFLAHAPPVDDVHNVPGVCLDSRGYVHAITGAHGRPFIYRCSLSANDTESGFTEPEPVLADGRQTYLSLVCDSRDTLHIAYRQWRDDQEIHGGMSFAALSTQSKPREGPWGPAKPMVMAPVSGYSIYYHKLTIDRRDRLFLSYNHWTSEKMYRHDFPERYHHRAVITSTDHGASWKLAESGDFRP